MGQYDTTSIRTRTVVVVLCIKCSVLNAPRQAPDFLMQSGQIRAPKRRALCYNRHGGGIAYSEGSWVGVGGYCIRSLSKERQHSHLSLQIACAERVLLVDMIYIGYRYILAEYSFGRARQALKIRASQRRCVYNIHVALYFFFSLNL